MYLIINRRGLSFSLKAESRKDACLKLMTMLGKRSLPDHIDVVAA